MRKITILAAFALATLATPAMARKDKQDKQDKKAKQERVDDRGEGRNRSEGRRDQGHSMRDPRKRAEMMADKLNFTAEQRARLASLNARYPGENIDRKAYHEEFRTIMTDSQRQQAEEWKKQRAEGKGKGKDKGNRQNKQRD
jgi:hypothetical protein